MYDILGDSSKPRSWSKYANDSSNNANKASDTKLKKKSRLGREEWYRLNWEQKWQEEEEEEEEEKGR